MLTKRSFVAAKNYVFCMSRTRSMQMRSFCCVKIKNFDSVRKPQLLKIIGG
ncbi:MAG: hypothetical protein ACXVHM_03900 [Methanobacterium sp.]